MNSFRAMHSLTYAPPAKPFKVHNEPELWAQEEDGWEDLDLFTEDLEPDAPQVADSVKDSIQLYLHEIGQVPLLTAAEERKLGQEIMQGIQAQKLLAQETYQAGSERLALERDVAQAAEARRKLIQANLRLVVSIAKKYLNSAMAFMDLVQEGNIGLMRAVEKFDYQRGNRFSTYATWWIRQAVTRAIAEQERLIRLPVHFSDSLTQLRRAVHALEQALAREPTPEELALVLGISLRKVTRLLQTTAQPISLEQPLTNDMEGRVESMLTDEQAETPLEFAAQRMLKQELVKVLNSLPERERMVLVLRYGLVGGQQRTLQEVGKAFGITRERTRQIEFEALRRIREPEVGLSLRGYLD